MRFLAREFGYTPAQIREIPMLSLSALLPDSPDDAKADRHPDDPSIKVIKFGSREEYDSWRKTRPGS